MALEAELALEWWRASGERTRDRLRDLVHHFCRVNGVAEPEIISAIEAQAFHFAGLKE